MDTQKAAETTSVRIEETSAPSLPSFVQVVPSTSIFAGWGPRMETNLRSILRRN